MAQETSSAKARQEAENRAHAEAFAASAPPMGEALRSRLSVLLTPAQDRPARRRRRA